ncbi:MAG: hypothetical protein ABI186_03610, partial [Candidatus Elarobacter sp.]
MLVQLRPVLVLMVACSLAACGSHTSQTTTTADESTQTPAAAAADVASPPPAIADDSASAPPSAAPEVSAAPADASAATAVPANGAATAATGAPDGTSGTLASADCPLLPNKQVGDVMHLSIAGVKMGSSPERCDFSFTEDNPNAVSIAYSAQGGVDELRSARQASEGAKTIFGGIAKAAGAGSAPPGLVNVVSATPPPNVPKVGDDQYFVSVGPSTIFIATKGDAYVEASASFMPG